MIQRARMPTKYRNAFFEEPREASLIKLSVLEKYLVPWIRKVGYTAHMKQLCVVDGFAGRGEYADGTPGSPRRILDAARDASEYEVRCIFVEKSPRHATSLRALCSRYPTVDQTVIQGDFRERVDAILPLVGGRPLLALIDPFGIKDLDLQKIGALVNSTKKCDLVVTFVDSAAARLAGTYPDDVARAIGPGASKDYAETFARNMAAEGAFLPGGRFAINQSFDSGKKYELIVFSRSEHAYQLWNDFMTTEWREQRAAHTRGKFPPQSALPGMASWASADDAERDLEAAATEILGWCHERAGRQFLRREMIGAFVVERFASFHTSTLKRALRRLEAQGKVVSDSEKGTGIERRVWRVSG